jgi:DNA processing protein
MQTHRRLSRLVDLGDPQSTFARILAGEKVIEGVENHVWEAWRGAHGLDRVMDERCGEHGITVLHSGSPGYPAQFTDRFAQAPVLFVKGHTPVLGKRRVGIIGTRTASMSGVDFARRLGRDLALNNVTVVSGLARGIDVNAHRGVLAVETGTPVAVVACGLDVVYPPEHTREWALVAERGLLVSEHPPGTAPETHHFPQRNRILATLSESLVVVESRNKGGSMITVREALKRNVTVMAVPGSPHVAVANGTNELIKDGCAPVTCIDDVMTSLDLSTSGLVRHVDTRDAPAGREISVLAVFAGSPRTVDEIVLLCGLDAFEAGVVLGRLEAKGWVQHSNGWWEALTGRQARSTV